MEKGTSGPTREAVCNGMKRLHAHHRHALYTYIEHTVLYMHVHVYTSIYV